MRIIIRTKEAQISLFKALNIKVPQALLTHASQYKSVYLLVIRRRADLLWTPISSKVTHL